MINYTVVSRHSVLSVEFRKYAVVNKTVVIMHKKKTVYSDWHKFGFIWENFC